MKDIIEGAITKLENTKERRAEGTIDGHEVTLVKTYYDERYNGPRRWKVAVILGDGTVPSRQETDLESSQADTRFDAYLDMYDELEEVEPDE